MSFLHFVKIEHKTPDFSQSKGHIATVLYPFDINDPWTFYTTATQKPKVTFLVRYRYHTKT